MPIPARAVVKFKPGKGDEGKGGAGASACATECQWKVRRVVQAILFCGVGLMISCSPSGYDGYQTRSYTIRGIRYHPMTVSQALDYQGEGIASWYDESKFFGRNQGKYLVGGKR